jgi:hypothetical protein
MTSFRFQNRPGHLKYLGLIFGYLLTLLFVVSCGGGGGGGGGPAPISYTGITSQAVIDDSNASAVAFSGYQIGFNGSTVGGPVGASASQGASTSHAPRTIVLSKALNHALKKIPAGPLPSKSALTPLSTESDSFPGTCGGTASYSEDINDQTGDAHGTFSFDHYCDGGVTLHGSMTFVATGNQVDITTDSLNTTVCGDSFTISGTIDATVESLTSMSMFLNLLVRDDDLSKVYRLEDYSVSVSSSSASSTASEFGRFYDPDYGYVQVTTTQSMVIFAGDPWPSSGIVEIVGASGVAGGSTRARLTASGPTYLIEADTTGDGQFDFSETNEWPEAACPAPASGEDEGSFGSPVPVTVGTPRTSTIGPYGTSYYGFTASAGGGYVISLTQVTPGVDLDWELDTSGGGFITDCVNDVSSGDETCSAPALVSGQAYVIIVDSFTNQSATFTLQVTKQ